MAKNLFIIFLLFLFYPYVMDEKEIIDDNPENITTEQDLEPTRSRPKRSDYQGISMVISIILAVTSILITIFQFANWYIFPRWLYLTALVLSIISFIFIFIAVLGLIFNTGSLMVWWFLDDAIAVFIQIIAYLISLLIDVITENS